MVLYYLQMVLNMAWEVEMQDLELGVHQTRLLYYLMALPPQGPNGPHWRQLYV